MNSTNIFSTRAIDYAKYRPSYPVEAIATILEGLKPASQLVAADIGAGTGIGSRMLGNCGVKVIAIEPNPEMIQAAEPHTQVEFHLRWCYADQKVTAQATQLPDASVDLVTSFQAFHWFDPLPTLQEFHRILKPFGRLALVWSTWDREDAFTRELCELELQASNPSSEHVNWDSRVGAPPKNPYFSDFEKYQFDYQQQLDREGLIGLVQSQGFIPLTGAKSQQLVKQLQELHYKWANSEGNVCIVYRTDTYLAQISI